jgi:uncharacterized protein (DUF433 family)
VERKEHFSLRLQPATVRRLLKQARTCGLTKTQLAERYIEEAVRMAEHPGIVFRERSVGRRAALAGHRLDVWQVVETLHAEGGRIDAAAKYLALSRGLVEPALGYYADYQGEVEELIKRNTAMATAGALRG